MKPYRPDEVYIRYTKRWFVLNKDFYNYSFTDIIIIITITMSLTTTVTENGTLSTNGRFYEKPHDRPEGEGAARYPEGNPRPNTTLYQA